MNRLIQKNQAATGPGEPPPVLEVSGLVKSFGGAAGEAPVIDGLDLRVPRGAFVCVVGPSGCGKTTLLRSIAGLAPHDAGEVRVCGKAVHGPSRELAVVFQEYARSLLPWSTVEANVRLPLKYLPLSRAEVATRVKDALQAVGLWESRGKHPWQLSGGMQQRVAIARALAYRSEVLLMDEPFASVDAQTRTDLEDLILKLWEQQDMTVVLVTHDIDEAVYLADTVVVLSTSPARVIEQRTVSIARPRDQIATKTDPEFAEHRARIFELLK
ncbi:ABC transporter ATP-binding protein [Spirillospora sp. NPDC048819]|uniref:ABC transporter ATP-binding protein n=1 Tax=Spirillospora sp. NPDC048819 TaxID=3155268 RepID=UPI0033E8CD95